LAVLHFLYISTSIRHSVNQIRIRANRIKGGWSRWNSFSYTRMKFRLSNQQHCSSMPLFISLCCRIYIRNLSILLPKSYPIRL